MRQIVLIKAGKRDRLPTARDLRAAGFRVSSAVAPDAGTQETDRDGPDADRERPEAGRE